MADNDKLVVVMVIAMLLIVISVLISFTFTSLIPDNQFICEDYIIFDDGQSIRLINCNSGNVHYDYKVDIFVDKNNATN